jgi:hypothetical protein
MSEVLDNLAAMSAQLDSLVASYQEQAALCRENLPPATANARISELARADLQKVRDIHYQASETHKAIGANEAKMARMALSQGRVGEVQMYFEREVATLAQ